MMTIEELKAKQAKDLAKLQTEQALAALCPIPPKFAFEVSSGEKAWITYEASDLWAAIDIMAKFQPIAFYKFKGTYTRYEPEAINDKRTRDKGTCDDVPQVALIEVNHGEGFGPNVDLVFFAYLGDDICKIKIDLHRGLGPDSWWNYGPRFVANERGQSRRLEGKRYISGDFLANSKLSGMTDTYTKWGSGSADASRYTYSLCADYANADYSADWTDARLRLENIANAMHGERKGIEQWRNNGAALPSDVRR